MYGIPFYNVVWMDFANMLSACLKSHSVLGHIIGMFIILYSFIHHVSLDFIHITCKNREEYFQKPGHLTKINLEGEWYFETRTTKYQRCDYAQYHEDVGEVEV